MKAKVILWDFDGKGRSWLANEAELLHIELLDYIEKDKSFNLSDIHHVDYLLISARNIPQSIAQQLASKGLWPQKVIVIGSSYSWAEHEDAALFLMRESNTWTYRYTKYLMEAKQHDYVTCSVKGNISYIGSSKDNTIMAWMYVCQRNWSDKDMHIFYELAHKYYDIDDSKQGWFLDLGANIGTTCIYFKKQVDPSVRILAFEPEKNNFRMLETNMRLNGLHEQDAILVNAGLSDKEEVAKIYIEENNPGANSIIANQSTESEEVKLIALDEYISEHDISLDSIKYIWLDTEGFEAVVLNGARKLFSQRKVPLFMECNPAKWEKMGHYEMLINFLKEHYTSYIVIQEYEVGKRVSYPIGRLEKDKKATSVFDQYDIFLLA